MPEARSMVRVFVPWQRHEADAKYAGLDIEELISRAPGRAFSNTSDAWALQNMATFRASGRHVLNVWRLMRTELELSSYTLENTVFHLLHRRYEFSESRILKLTSPRIPKYEASTLTEWHNSPVPAHRARWLQHLLGRSTLVLEILDAADVVAKTAFVFTSI